jgi:hypothetical protein
METYRRFECADNAPRTRQGAWLYPDWIKSPGDKKGDSFAREQTTLDHAFASERSKSPDNADKYLLATKENNCVL